MLFRRIDKSLSLSLAIPYFADELFLLTDANRKFLGKWLGWLDQIKEPEHTRSYLADQMRRFAEGEALVLLVMHDQKVIGVTGFHKIDSIRKRGSIGYWLDQKHNGKGIMTRAVSELIEVGRFYYGMQRIEIRCATENRRSRTLPERLGFRHEGTQRHAERLGGRWLDHEIYVKTWAAEQPDC